MNKILLFMLLSLSSIFFSSCHSDEPEPDTPQTAAKTIFVFMPYTGDMSPLYTNFLTNLDDMEAAINDNRGLGGDNLIVYISKDARTSHLIKFNYSHGHCLRDTLKTYTTAGYTTTSGMTAILNDMKQLAPALTYATIVGSHGEGWLPKRNTTRFFGGDRYQMDVTDFAQSIHDAGLKMQFILFDDCYMSGIEVAYDLRDCADWLIASTSEMMDYGMPYRKILKHLLPATPDYDTLCRDFISFYNNYRMPYGTIAAVDLSHIGEMATLMHAINTAHTFDMSLIGDVQDLDAKHYTPTVYFDFGSYTRRLCGDDAAAMAQYESLLGKLVPYKAATSYIYSYSGNATELVSEFSGLTVSDPSVNTVAADTKKQTAWWQATH